MAGWDPRTNYGVGTKVSLSDYSSSSSGGAGSSGFGGFKYTPPQSWDPKGNSAGSTIDWDKAANLKFDGINYQEPVFNPEREARDKLFNDLFGKTKETDKWQQQASQKWGINPTGDFGMMPGIGAQSGKVTDNLSFQQSASPSVAFFPGQQNPLASLAMTAGSALLGPVIGGAGQAIAKGLFG